MLTIKYKQDSIDKDMWHTYHVTGIRTFYVGCLHCDSLYDILDDLGICLHDITASDGANSDTFELKIDSAELVI